MDWKRIVFAIAICLIYIPMVFMAVNTFFPKVSYNTCYYPKEIPVAVGTLNQSELDAQYREMQECEQNYSVEREKYDGWKFIAIMILSIVAALVMLLKLDKSIVLGLFLGVVITALVATIRYMESRSIPGFILLVILFVLIIFFVNIKRKEK